jgi:predicted RNase H-like HicB family nuclease
MTMYVLIENKPAGKYTASLLGWPAIKAQGKTEDEALAQLRQSLARQLKGGRIVPLEIDIAPNENPWLQLAGIFKDDPFAQEVQESIAAYRRDLDAQDETA